MQYRDNRVLYDGSAFSRLWEKSAIGILTEGPALLLSDSEVIFCRDHRGVEFDGLVDQEAFSLWLSGRLSKNSKTLLEAAVLEALRVPGNKVVLSDNFERLSLGESESWAMRWSSDNHPSKGSPDSEILWFESKEQLYDIERGEAGLLADLLNWTVRVDERGRIPEVLVIDDEQSVVTYRLSEEDPIGEMPQLTDEIISEITSMDSETLDNNGIFVPGVSNWPIESVGIPLQGGRLLDSVEAEIIQSDSELSISASILNDLWMRGLNTRSGFKYGTTWRCYPGQVGDSHAPWLVVDPTSEAPDNWSEACLSSRLASGVNKKWLFPINDNGEWRYLQISRPPSDSRWSNPKRHE